MTDFNFDPFRLGGLGYLLDQIPTPAMARVMQRLYDGDRIVLARDGRGYVWENSPSKLRRYLVEAILNKRWASAPHPDGPLFGQPTDGTLKPTRLLCAASLRSHSVNTRRDSHGHQTGAS